MNFKSHISKFSEQPWLFIYLLFSCIVNEMLRTSKEKRFSVKKLVIFSRNFNKY